MTTTEEYTAPRPDYQPLEPREHFFNTIVGHEQVKRLIWNMVRKGRLPQAILLKGPEGVGKRSMAYAMAKLVNGEPSDTSDAEPSRAARNIASGEYLDMRVLRPRGATSQILIEEVREVSDWAYLTPIEARKKIILFEDAERITVNAANCFLKVLEEPPAHCLIVLVSAAPHRLLATIRSRCSSIALHPVTREELVEWLMALHNKEGESRMDREQAVIAALLGEGRPGRALSHVGAVGELADEEAPSETDLWSAVEREREEGEAYGVDPELRRKVAELVDRFYAHGFAATFGVASELHRAAGSLEAALSLLLMWYRDLALRALAGEGGTDLAVNRDLLEAAPTSHTPRDVGALERCLSAIMEATRDQRRPGINAALALESLFMRLGRIGN